MTDEELAAIRGRWEKHKTERMPHSGAVLLPAPDVSRIDGLLAEVDRLRKQQAAAEASEIAWREDRQAKFDLAHQQIKELLRYHLPDVGVIPEWLTEGIMTFGTNRYVEGLIEARERCARVAEEFERPSLTEDPRGHWTPIQKYIAAAIRSITPEGQP